MVLWNKINYIKKISMPFIRLSFLRHALSEEKIKKRKNINFISLFAILALKTIPFSTLKWRGRCWLASVFYKPLRPQREQRNTTHTLKPQFWHKTPEKRNSLRALDSHLNPFLQSFKSWMTKTHGLILH